MFSMKTGTVMEGSKIKYRHWAVGISLHTTNIKGISSMRLHRELGIGQKAAWCMLHRLRDAFEKEIGQLVGPVEVDETFIGGKRKNISNAKRKALEDVGCGAVGKTAIVGMKDQEISEITITASVIDDTDAKILQGFVKSNADENATIYRDGATAHNGLPFDHESVNQSVSKYMNGIDHANGIESFWALMKRGYHEIYHQMRHVKEFAGRYNDRDFGTNDQMDRIVSGMGGKRLRYADLITNGFHSGAR